MCRLIVGAIERKLVEKLHSERALQLGWMYRLEAVIFLPVKSPHLRPNYGCLFADGRCNTVISKRFLRAVRIANMDCLCGPRGI